MSARRRISAEVLPAEEAFSLALQSEVIHPAEDGLVFLHTEEREDGSSSTRTVRLRGRWRLTPSNELRFRVKYSEKELAFAGAWKIGKFNELVYEAVLAERKKGYAFFETLTFRGAWELGRGFRLSYQLEGTPGRLELAGRIARFETSNGRARIHYARGAAARARVRPARLEELVLFGLWRPISRTELGFEIKLRGGGTSLLKLRGAWQIRKGTWVELSVTEAGDFSRPRFAVKLSRTVLKGRGEIFLKGETDFGGEHFLGIGGNLKW